MASFAVYHLRGVVVSTVKTVDAKPNKLLSFSTETTLHNYGRFPFILTINLKITRCKSTTLRTSQIEDLTSLPGQPPGHLNFLKIFVPIPPSPGGKGVQMPPPPGELPDYCFNFLVASIMLLKLCI